MTVHTGRYKVKHVRRLPFEPLAEICARRWREPNESGAHSITETAKVAAVLGTNRHTPLRWARDGLTDLQADRAAIALGLHPLDVWPDYHDDIDLEGAA